MRVVLQRVQRGAVTVDGEIVGQVEHGFVALVGITHTDTETEVDLLARKTAQLRVFRDDEDKMNRSVVDVGGGILVISQFTLYADAKKGRRPSFIDAARPDTAEPLVDAYVAKLREYGVTNLATGVFGANMLVDIQNDGPVTIILDSSTL